MNRSTAIRTTMTCAALAAATLSFAKDELRPEKERPAQGRRLTQVMEYNILIQDDEPAGKVVDFVLSDGGCIDYIVALHDDQYYVIPYSAAVVRYDDSIVFVDIAPAKFQQVQFFANDNWPDFYATGYSKQIFTTFGVNAARRGGNATFRRDLGDDAADRRRDRREDRQENRQDRRDDRKDRDDDAARDDDKDAPAAKNPKDPSDRKPAPKAEPKSKSNDTPTPPAPKADAPKPKAAPNAPTPKSPAPIPAAPKKPVPPQPK